MRRCLYTDATQARPYISAVSHSGDFSISELSPGLLVNEKMFYFHDKQCEKIWTETRPRTTVERLRHQILWDSTTSSSSEECIWSAEQQRPLPQSHEDIQESRAHTMTVNQEEESYQWGFVDTGHTAAVQMDYGGGRGGGWMGVCDSVCQDSHLQTSRSASQ